MCSRRSDGSIFSAAAANEFLTKLLPLFQSNANVCFACKANLPLQSALLQAVNVLALYVLQEDAYLQFRRRAAAQELATLKPIAKALTDLFGGGAAAAATAPPKDPNVETEQEVFDRLTAASREPLTGNVLEAIKVPLSVTLDISVNYLTAITLLHVRCAV